jgi:hypothetical protein
MTLLELLPKISITTDEFDEDIHVECIAGGCANPVILENAIGILNAYQVLQYIYSHYMEAHNNEPSGVSI